MSSWTDERFPMVRSTAMSMVVGLAVFGLAACGGDDNGGPTDPGDDISEEQAAEVAAAVSAGIGHAFGLALAGGGSASMAPGALTPGSVDGMPVAAETFDWNFDNSGACPEGGNASTSGSGTITSTEGSGSTTVDWDWNADVDYNDCGVSTDNGIFTLSTSSPLNFTGTGTVTSNDQGGGTGSFTWNFNGTVDWNGSGDSGSCSINMTTSLDFSSSGSGGGSWTGSISGSVCGQSVDETWDTTITV